MSDRQSIERVFPKKKVNDEIKSKGEVRKKTKKIIHTMKKMS